MADDAEKEADNIACTVCGDAGDYDNDRFIFCDGCDAGFHQSCYGLQDETFTDSENDKFYCYHCAQIERSPHKIVPCTRCMLCAMDRGSLAIMAVEGDNSMRQFVHVICAYAFHCNQSENGQKVVVDHEVLRDCKSGKCSVCDTTKGFKIACAHPQCDCKVHPSCARIKHNEGDDSFYFDDVNGTRFFRNPLYFCRVHAVGLKVKRGEDGKSGAIKLLKAWKQKKKKKKVNRRGIRKRKRESGIESEEVLDLEPTRKKRKIDKMKEHRVDAIESLLVAEEEDIVDPHSTIKSSDGPRDANGGRSIMIGEGVATPNGDSLDLKEKGISNQSAGMMGEEVGIGSVHEQEQDSSLSSSFEVDEDEVTHRSPSSQPSREREDDDRYDTLRELKRIRERKTTQRTESKISSKKKRVQSMADIHQIPYGLDKCFCSHCVEQPLPPETDNKMEERDQMQWFNESVWFNTDFTFRQIGYEEQRTLSAPFCRDIHIEMDHSPTMDYGATLNQKEEMAMRRLDPFDSITMYNYAAINDETLKVPQSPFQNVKGDDSVLFYGQTYRDIVINCGGAIQCIECCPLNRYHNKNPFNYLCIFADSHDKHHSVQQEHGQIVPINDNEDDDDGGGGIRMQRKDLIQIWKIRKSQSFTKKARKQCDDKDGWTVAAERHKNAVFHYGILHRGGFIWDLKWVPFQMEHHAPNQTIIKRECDDGKHNDSGDYLRLGLLAVCSTDAMVHIYSLPIIRVNDAMVDISAVTTLKIVDEAFTRLSWSCHLTYPLLIAATANGTVSMWNMEDLNQSLMQRNEQHKPLKIEDEQMVVVGCYKAPHRIVALDWCSNHESCFVTISENGCLRIWNVNDPFIPLWNFKLHCSAADLQWIPGTNSAVITGESMEFGRSGNTGMALNVSSSSDATNDSEHSTPKKGSGRKDAMTKSCSKLVSLWSWRQIMEEKKSNPLRMHSRKRKRKKKINEKKWNAVQVPAEKLYAVLNKVAHSVDVLIGSQCIQHRDEVNKDSNDTKVYILVGYNSGNVILYQRRMDQLVDHEGIANGQIMSQLVFDAKCREKDGETLKCRIRGPFYGIHSRVHKKRCSDSRRAWTEEESDAPIFDPYHVSNASMALDDCSLIRKVKLCLNEGNLDIISGSISGIIRVQTILR